MSAVEYISTSTNRFNHAADISAAFLAAFGSGKLVALWNTQVRLKLYPVFISVVNIRALQDSADRGVLETLPGHSGLLTCVKFLQDDRIVSADDTGALRLWRFVDSKAGLPFKYILYKPLNNIILNPVCILSSGPPCVPCRLIQRPSLLLRYTNYQDVLSPVHLSQV